MLGLWLLNKISEAKLVHGYHNEEAFIQNLYVICLLVFKRPIYCQVQHKKEANVDVYNDLTSCEMRIMQVEAHYDEGDSSKRIYKPVKGEWSSSIFKV